MAGEKDPLPPGSTIGILGGGQLGRMLAMAAAQIGFKTHIFSPEEDCPAFQVASDGTLAAYDDEAALTTFAGYADVITYEFENVPARAAEILSPLKPVRPAPKALAIAQDRLIEKNFLQENGIDTAPFVSVADRAGAAFAAGKIGVPGILKTRRFGYDGKGQAKITEGKLAAAAFDLIGAPAIYEGFVDFEREISIIAARGLNGTVESYDVVENIHEHHILSQTLVPARIGKGESDTAKAIATRVLSALDYVGVMGIEMFLTRDLRVLVNEFAPRVHNSGHWTLDACGISQFEQHIRAICGWPLGSPSRHSDAIMRNLIGDDVFSWPKLVTEPNAHLHLYGKSEARPARKMGHVTYLFAKGHRPEK
jgi:5-(carboxyamino)imidazole ribonucleotide synthase